MKVIVAGEDPFVREVGKLCKRHGHDTTMILVEDFISALQSGYILDDLADAEVIIELHNESAAAKHELLMAIGQAVRPDTLILASALATSATQAGGWVPNPERVVGFGILPPLVDVGVVELAGGLLTGDEAMTQAKHFWDQLGYEPVIVGDGSGLIRARIIGCLINEAISALLEGVATIEDIDQAMKLGTNYPFGPLEWADYLGLDTVLGIMRGLYDEWGDDRYRPSPLLKRMVIAGKLGKKSGSGFYEYDGVKKGGA
ncbi:MAG: hypothetical protein KDE59_00035 [Anaerolineales bacterium]|nr:hypothetical protein [Anaerolineales bacterium]MCB0011839.1 hypothetical protein [Anaerolineales bacterium]MCB8961230.1 3-hydroxybutyryl-CoA dehydrogenase [Ardenticatenales bacterium]